jgi:hypothetical protein
VTVLSFLSFFSYSKMTTSCCAIVLTDWRQMVTHTSTLISGNQNQ